MKKWPIYRYFSVLSQNSGNFGQNEEGVKNGHFPHSLRFCHNWLASGGVPGVRYADKLSELFYLHWESFWPGVFPNSTVTLIPCRGEGITLAAKYSIDFLEYLVILILK